MPTLKWLASRRLLLFLLVLFLGAAISTGLNPKRIIPKLLDPDHCLHELQELFGPFKPKKKDIQEAKTTSFVVILFGEAFRAPNGHQNYRAISNDSWLQSQALRSILTHVIDPWHKHGLELSQVIAHTYPTPLKDNLQKLLEETFKVPVTCGIVRNDTGWKAAATLYPGVQLIEPGKHALLLRYDLFFFQDIPPPFPGRITLPHCGEIKVDLKSHVADSFAWVPSSKMESLREYLLANHHWSHNVGKWLKPFSLFYPVHMNVNPRDNKPGQDRRGSSRPYDLMGRTERATPAQNLSLNSTLRRW
jgi:hypothetical protein